MWFQSWSFWLAWSIIVLGCLAVLAWAQYDRARERRADHERWLAERKREVEAHIHWQQSLRR